MITEQFENITLINGDCMELMRSLPDKYFDLGITDPPYGQLGWDKKPVFHKGAFTTYPEGKKWDTKPDKAYFNELQRVCKNYIIWGANYFSNEIDLSAHSWIVWNKQQVPDLTNFAMGELAVYSGKKPLQIYSYSFRKNKNNSVNSRLAKKYAKIHPCQKPVALYKWLLMTYAQTGDKILDTHLGSGSIAIACSELNFELTGCEIDADYYNGAKKRLNEYLKQTKIF